MDDFAPLVAKAPGRGGGMIASGGASGPGIWLGDPLFNDFIARAFDYYGVDPARIGIEITETAAVTHLEQAIALIDRLRGFGVEVAFDDFGSGMSSFAYLKIDGAFVRDWGNDPVDPVTVRSMRELASTHRRRGCGDARGPRTGAGPGDRLRPGFLGHRPQDWDVAAPLRVGLASPP